MRAGTTGASRVLAISSLGGARTPGCRADPPRSGPASGPVGPTNRGPGWRGAWRSRTPAPPRAALPVAQAVAAAAQRYARSADRWDAAPAGVEPAGHSAAFARLPRDRHGDPGPRRRDAGAGSLCASPDYRSRLRRAWLAVRPAPDAAARRCQASGAAG